MPLVLADGLVILAFALVAIAAVELVRTMVVQPLNSASGKVAGIPVVGGSLAWALRMAADEIEYGLQALAWMAQQGKSDAVNAWQWLATFTADNIFPEELKWVAWIKSVAPTLEYDNSIIGYIWHQAYSVVPDMVRVVQADLSGLHYWIDHYQNPLIAKLGDDLIGLRNYVTSTLGATIAGIGNDLAGLRDWLDHTVLPGIDARIGQLNDALRGVQADVNTRAYARDLEAANARIDSLAKQLAQLGVLAPLLALSAEAINELVKTAEDPCRCADVANLSELEARISALEVD